jgi:ribonuclease P protein component
VRRFGKSYAHPLVVLVVMPGKMRKSRYGVAAGRSVGKAVQRNRAKRRLREAIRLNLNCISPGWDMLLIARQPLNQATFSEILKALVSLLKRANLWLNNENC